MNKQQAAEKAYPANFPTSDNSQKIFIAGVDWHEAQCPGDAVELKAIIAGIIEDGHDKATYASEGGMGPDTTPCNDLIKYCVPKLLALFNPSGAAPQAKCHHEPFSKDATICGLCGDKLPAPQPAGPVWVKASERIPTIINEWPIYFEVKNSPHYGKYDYKERMFLDENGEYHLREQVRWLDEGNAQQVFTREEAYKMAMDMGRHFRDVVPTLAGINDWFNINYPPK